MIFRDKSEVEIRYNTIYKSKGNIAKVEKVIIHPSHIQSTLPFKITNDIAILIVEKPLNLEPICLPKLDDDPINKTNLIVSGWGDEGDYQLPTEELMTIQVPAVSRVDCNDQLIQHSQKYGTKVTQNVNDEMFCAGLEEGGKGVCTVR